MSARVKAVRRALNPGEAAKILGTDPRMLRRWDELGAFPGTTFYLSGRQYDAADVDRVLREITTINEGFEWLQEIIAIKFEHRWSWLSVRQVVVAFDVSFRTAARWLEDNLLPYYRGTPLSVPGEIRRVPRAYCEGLLAYAAGRAIHPSLLEEYRDQCAERRAIE